MAYRIAYENIGPKKQKRSNRVKVLSSIIVICGVLAVVLHSLQLPWVQKLLLPGDSAVTAAALEGLAENLSQGKPLGDAITVFCRRVINGA